MTVGLRSRWAGAFLVATTTVTAACATVPQNRRQYLADPTMSIVDDPLEAKAMRKLFNTREGAAGGDTEAAGGGCGCGN